MNYNSSINLLKLNNVGVMTVQGNTEAKRCLVIPIADNDLYEHIDQATNTITSISLSLTFWENKQPSQYGDTHIVKQRFSKNFRELHEEQVRQSPILGNVKPITTATPATAPDYLNGAVADTQVPF